MRNNEPQPQTQKVLAELEISLKQGIVTKEQVLAIINEQSNISSQKITINIQRILYYIGGFILLLGIIFYIGQYWGTIDKFSRVVVTLGSAVAAFSLGYYFYNNIKSKDLGHAFLIIAAALFPLGIGTALDAIGMQATTSWAISINTAILFIIYFTSYYQLKANVFLLFSFAAASTLFFSFTNVLVGNPDALSHFYEYRVLILGIIYIFFGYYFFFTSKKFMTNILYFFGLLMVLGSTLWLQGFGGSLLISSDKNFIWELLYPFILVSVFKGSIKLQNGIFLLMGTLFTFAEILKITSEYFSNTVGWPLALMIAGLLMMSTGYLSFELNKRYVKGPKEAEI